MKTRHFSWIAALLPLAAVLSAAAPAPLQAGAIYNMDFFLNEPHPFAVPAPPRAIDVPVATPPAAPVSGRRQPPPLVAQSVVQLAAPAGRGVLSELKLGLLIHDEGPFSHNKEDGIDGNMELLFNSPDLLDFMWSPRPHLGFSINSAGDTNQYYLGLTWDWFFWRDFFLEYSLGGAVHDGETTAAPLGRKELGCQVLFRQALAVGYRLAGRHTLSVFLDHISNAKLCDTNEGLENFGFRYGYLF